MKALLPLIYRHACFDKESLFFLLTQNTHKVKESHFTAKSYLNYWLTSCLTEHSEDHQRPEEKLKQSHASSIRHGKLLIEVNEDSRL